MAAVILLIVARAASFANSIISAHVSEQINEKAGT
jgi:hypothetical protein